MTEDKELMDKVVSLTKRRGFIYQGSEIYGGLAGTWDYGPLGVSLKNNIKKNWWKQFVEDKDDTYGIDAAILMNPKVWEASGHLGAGFADPLVECSNCKKRFREDTLEEKEKCPECKKGELSEPKQFNMMFKTQVGATDDSNSVSYLRPETAQGIFVNFKNIIDSFHPKLPFGVAQIGKAFRNEIAPRDFLFRTREFEQMEIEYFVREDEWKESFENFLKETRRFLDNIGLSKDKISELEVSEEDRAHYSKRTVDIEYDFPFGRKELYGLAYRTDFDLKNHSNVSGQRLEYLDDESGEKIIPHVIEPSFGVDRIVLALLVNAYTEDNLGNNKEEKRVVLKLAPSVAPIKVAVFPLLKNKPDLVEKAREIYSKLKASIPDVVFDDNGNVGKRYRRQDEIGTPFCVTVDFETLEKGNGVTIRDRDTGEQERLGEDELVSYLTERL
jgi:glycyl-tRNA synthetase